MSALCGAVNLIVSDVRPGLYSTNTNRLHTLLLSSACLRRNCKMAALARSPPLDEELGHFDTIPLLQLPKISGAQTHRSELASGTAMLLRRQMKSPAWLHSRKYPVPRSMSSSPMSLSKSKTLRQLAKSMRRFNNSKDGKVVTWKGPFDKLIAFARSAESRRVQRIRQSRFYRWRIGVLSRYYTSTIVLLCNITIIIIGSTRDYDKDGVADLIKGDEPSVSQWNTVLHVIINALSTVLLSSSNYTVQVLSSPTRGILIKPIRGIRWLDIGILSLRNMRALPRKRTWLCLLLSLSSIPLHLLYVILSRPDRKLTGSSYNASVFKIIASNDWNLYVVDARSDDFLKANANIDSPTSPYSKMVNIEWRSFCERKHICGHGDLFLIIDGVGYNTSQQFNQTPSSEALRTGWSRDIAISTNLFTGESDKWIRLPLHNGLDSQSMWAHVALALSSKVNNQSPVQISL